MGESTRGWELAIRILCILAAIGSLGVFWATQAGTGGPKSGGDSGFMVLGVILWIPVVGVIVSPFLLTAFGRFNRRYPILWIAWVIVAFAVICWGGYETVHAWRTTGSSTSGLAMTYAIVVPWALWWPVRMIGVQESPDP